MTIAGHDLKTPLRTAGHAIDKVSRKLDPETAAQLEPAREALGQINREFDQLASLAVAGGEFAKPDLMELPLQDILDSLAATWRRPAETRGLTLRVVPTSLRVPTHRTLLSTLLGNLVGNAIKYTETGKVLVGCRRSGSHAVVEIIDTGVGMDGDDAREVFNAFRQTNARSEGLGLGLWIVSHTAQTLGYPVTVQTRKGHGSRFAVTLPRAND